MIYKKMRGSRTRDYILKKEVQNGPEFQEEVSYSRAHSRIFSGFALFRHVYCIAINLSERNQSRALATLNLTISEK